MKAGAFDYLKADSVEAALRAAAADATADTRFMAGSQSLGPMLNLRLAEPDAVIDIRKLAALRTHRVDNACLTIGAAITHAEIEDGMVADTTHGMLPAVARNIAYRAIRNRGTIGGSLAHADPAADWVNCLTVLGATCHIVGSAGPRKMAAAEFIRGAYQTALGAGELLTAIELPPFTTQMRWGYYKISTKVGEFASAIGAVVVDPGLGLTSLLVGATEAKPLLLPPLSSVPGLTLVLTLAEDAARDAIAAHLAQIMPQAGGVFVHQHATALARAISQMNRRANEPTPNGMS